MSLGFIVFNASVGSVTSLLYRDNDFWKCVPSGGVLLVDNKTATVFKDRRGARAAVNRTKRYLRNPRRHVDPSLGRVVTANEYEILRLVPENIRARSRDSRAKKGGAR